MTFGQTSEDGRAKCGLSWYQHKEQVRSALSAVKNAPASEVVMSIVAVSDGDAAVRQSDCRRPVDFDPSLAERICKRLSNGENLRRFCVWPYWPTKSTVVRWAKENDAFGVRYRQILRSRENLKLRSEHPLNTD